MESGITDALLLLDREKKVRYVGRAMEDLIAMRLQYAEGQNISDACRDPSFAGTVIEMSDRVLQSLGDNQQSTLDINGLSRDLIALALKNSQQEIRFILIVVKLGGKA